ncbi:mucin TcMUCII [Trypanosoma cruzi cruzi]|uniref:Putative mucin TcMUCII n=1 Tax=Trypanosoma cruzi TaxID=5693 RepID=A0A2V2W4A3_TRYCR|nr:mucin TcMUCII [Trypanosoma cruzi cruzi]PWV03361.1 putative mucin TcMUCII [Trypanosoma cruzi]
MMTCRLLCALLVLALCCCPSVCVAGSEDPTGKSGKGSVSGIPKPEEQGQETELHSTNSPPQEIKDEGRGTEDSQKMETLASNITSTVTETPQSQNSSNNAQNQDDGGSNGRTEHTNTVTANEQKKTDAPTTTTTTTTTQAPSTTTTTEAPTTTTTRAPSRLREIDGSLSSSAWVCAPLLLAASALAYTTVG